MSPKEQMLYDFNKKQEKLKNKIVLSKRQIKVAYEHSKTSLFRDFGKNLDPAVKSFFQSSFGNVIEKKPSWKPSDKAYALARYKRVPRCYNFLEEIFSYH